MHDNACGISILNSRLSQLHEIANKELAKYDFGEDCYEVEFEMMATSPLLPQLIMDLDDFGNYTFSQFSQAPTDDDDEGIKKIPTFLIN